MSDEREIKLEELHGEMEDSDILDVHVDQILWKICQLENEIHDIRYKQAESKEFYDRRIESVNKQITYRRNLLESFM